MSKWGHLGIVMCLLLSTQVWASIGKVSLLKGEATANRNNQSIVLMNGTDIEKNDFIKTHVNSQIQLTFEDKTVITLGSESTLDIQDYLNDANNPKAKFKFNQGTFKTITGQIGKKAPENFNLETKTATIGIRGTTVAGRVGGSINEGGSIVLLPDLIGCSSGEILVSNAHGTMIVSQGFQTLVSIGQPPAPPVPLNPALIGSLYGNALQQQPSPPQGGGSDGEALSPSSIPSLAEHATQTSQQTATLTTINTQIETITSGFYPIFNPTLQASSSDVGTMALSGYATSQYTLEGTTIISSTDTLSLYLNTSDDRIDDSTMNLDRTTHIDQLSLGKNADSSTMTYKNINEFSIKDFDSYNGWIQTEKTYINDFVSWGYWAIKANDDTKLLETKNYWVAGKDSDGAITYITTLPANTHYIYTGKVLGSVTESGVSYNIASDTSSVQLKFNFGGGANSLYNDASYSWIRFTANGKQWDLTPTLNSPTVTYGEFSDSLTGTVTQGQTPTAITSGAIQGKFYGSHAEAVGGTFKATSGTSTASGVYKAVR
jgi:hypothetical protein